MIDPSLKKELADRISLGIESMPGLPPALPVERFVDYLELLESWSRAYNLTAIRDPGRMVTHHVLDSLSVLPYLRGEHCLDVGTGAGLPGLILAVSLPGMAWTLLDSNQKKTRFVNQAVLDLGLANVTVITGRVEDWHPAASIDCIVTRAFSELVDIYQKTRHLLGPSSRILAMKGEVKETGTAALNECVETSIHLLQVPGLDARRTLVEMRPLPTTN